MKRHGHARVNPQNPRAFAICDRCGFLFNRVDLQWEQQWVGRSLQNLRLLVCDTCLDVPQEQLRTIVLPPDPLPILNARPELADMGSSDAPIVRSNIAANSGIYALTGSTATLRRSIHLTLATGAYTMTGLDGEPLSRSGASRAHSNGFSNGFS